MNGCHNAAHGCEHIADPSCHASMERSTLYKVAVVVTGVALAVLGFMTAPEWFVISFAVGTVIGLYRGIQLPEGTRNIKPVKGCSTDLLEVIMDEELPPGSSFALAALTFACHIEHHPLPFVPLIGLATGYWTGRRLVDIGKGIRRQFR